MLHVGSSVCPSHLTLLTNDGEIDNELGADNPLTDVHNLSMGIRFWLRNFLLLLAVCGLLTTACLGGNGGHSTTYGTWSWDGSRWTQLAVTNQGKTLIADRLFYSTALGGLIDMNGTMWNGSGWVKSDSVPTPAPVGDGNQETSYVLDEATGELLFLDPNARTMWTWSVHGWGRVVSPSDWPEDRYLNSGGVAYDPYALQVLLVTESGFEAETSRWDGTRLQVLERVSQLPHATLLIVPDGEGHMMAFGQDDSGGSPTSGFLWDGKTWSVLPATSRLPRGVVSIAFNSPDQEIVAVGSDDGANFRTWRWHQTAWQLVATTSSPPDGKISNLVYDPALRGFVVTVLPADCVCGLI